MGLRQSQEQRQIIGQRMYQYMDILAMNMDEINRYVDDAMRENPLIELLTPPEHFTHYSDWDAERQDVFDRYSQQSAGKTLEAFLLEQIASLKLDESARSAVVYIICSMDENGYVPENIDRLNKKYSPACIHNALEIIQSLESAGVGARSLGECLQLQLARNKESDPLLYTLAHDYMPRLCRGQFKHIAKELNLPVKRIEAAFKKITGLQPKPGNGFGHSNYTNYVVADIELHYDNAAQKYIAAYLYDHYANIGLNDYYSLLISDSNTDAETRAYIKEKTDSAKWIIGCIQKRRDTLMSIAQLIAESRPQALRSVSAPIQPLSIDYAAERLNVSPSTVYRAIRDKYISTPRGVLSMAAFFDKAKLSAAPEAELCRNDISLKIKNLIANEPHPMSDSEIAKSLEADGIRISRRTVAKYREEMHIPSSSCRVRIKSEDSI